MRAPIWSVVVMKTMKATTMVFILMDRTMLGQRRAVVWRADSRHFAAEATARQTQRGQCLVVHPDICMV
jgi:hypothetical protein